MSTHTSLCFVLITILYLNVVNSALATSQNVEEQDQKRSSAVLFERFGVDPGYVSANRPYNDDDANTKRALKKKWARFFPGYQSPYTIAFPALIRSRRWIEQEE